MVRRVGVFGVDRRCGRLTGDDNHHEAADHVVPKEKILVNRLAAKMAASPAKTPKNAPSRPLI